MTTEITQQSIFGGSAASEIASEAASRATGGEFDQFDRRNTLKALGGMSVAALLPGCASPSAIVVPHSAGTSMPKMRVPEGACDSHIHIADARFRTDFPPQFAGATLDDYRLLQRRLGLRRAVVVQTKIHGMDHRCLIDALERLEGRGRGIGVLPPETSISELRRLHDVGMRGLRLSVWNPNDALTSLDMLRPLANKIADLGWHVQLHALADQIVAARDVLETLPCPVVFDHMGRLPPTVGTRHPAFGIIVDLLGREKAWLKLSGAYLNTEEGPPFYSDATLIAKAFCNAAPSRLVWGSDWPHATERTPPDDAVLLDLLMAWAPTVAVRHQILVENPANLYDF